MRFVVCFCLVLLVASQAVALDVEHKLLPNGLQVFVAENHSAPVFTMRVYINAGSIYEQEYLGCGISHYLEHLVSGGSTHKRPESDTERILSSIGGATNAYTTSDHTCYYIATSTAYTDSVIDLLSDWVLNCSLPQAEVDREKGVITREISMGRDEPRRRISKLYNGTMFVTHPEHFPTIGYLELFEPLTRDDVVKYYERMYVPANMHVVAVGDFDASVVMEKIETAFSVYPYEPPPTLLLPIDRKQMGMKYVEDDMEIAQTYMTMGFRTVTIAHEDVYPLHVLARILGSGRSSRLYRTVKDDLGLVHTINASSYNPQYHAPDFTVHVTCDYEKARDAQKAILGILYDIRDTYVTRTEIEKAKTQIASAEAFGFQEIDDQAGTIGVDVIRSGNPDYTEFYLRKIKEVTREDIMRVANTYFHNDALTIAVLKPTGSEVADEAEEVASSKSSDVTRIEMANGITLLLKEDHNVPLVNMRAYFRGGSALEDERTNGKFNMLARMLRRGTRRRSSDAISVEIDGMGGYLYSGSNEDYFTCNLDVLSENFDEGLALLGDVLMNSTFDEEEFEKERQTLVSLINQRDDDWQDDAEARLRKILYRGHPYGFDPRGERVSVEGLSRDEVFESYLNYCAPGNMVLAVFGDVDLDHAEAAVAKTFGRFKREAAEVPAVEAWDGLDAAIEKVQDSDRQQAVIFIGYPGMDVGSPDWYAARVLDAVISGVGYPGGWLHDTLRGQQLVYFVHAWNYVLSGKGYFAVLAATSPATADSALGIIREKIELAKADYVSDEEIEMGKRICKIMEDLYFSQTTAAQAEQAAQYEVLGLGYDYRYSIREKIDAVTKEQVREVARKYLTDSATLMIRPDAEAYETTMR
jgi:zinc protease